MNVKKSMNMNLSLTLLYSEIEIFKSSTVVSHSQEMTGVFHAYNHQITYNRTCFISA